MVGDVRLTLCLAFDRFIADLFAGSDTDSIVFDLSKAKGIDSTTLGLMAKISIQCQSAYHNLPVVISPDEGINRLLDTMGFNDIFEIIREGCDDRAARLNGDMTSLARPNRPDDEDRTKEKVLESHKILMSLNEQNATEFKDLVNYLEEH
jgi:anti-anti-sigma factor